MNYKRTEQDELMLDAYLVPSLDAAGQAWCEARQQFQMEPCGQNRNAYEKATSKLRLAFSAWADQLPGFREQLSMWLDSHTED